MDVKKNVRQYNMGDQRRGRKKPGKRSCGVSGERKKTGKGGGGGVCGGGGGVRGGGIHRGGGGGGGGVVVGSNHKDGMLVWTRRGEGGGEGGKRVTGRKVWSHLERPKYILNRKRGAGGSFIHLKILRADLQTEK